MKIRICSMVIICWDLAIIRMKEVYPTLNAEAAIPQNQGL